MDRIDQAILAVRVARITQAAWCDAADLVERVDQEARVNPMA